MPKGYYAILGIPRTATPAEIKRAFRRRARRLHPDVNPSPDATRQFQELNNAYRVLSNRLRRARYDRAGSAVIMRRRPSPAPPPTPAPAPARAPTRAPALRSALDLAWFLAAFFAIPLGGPFALLLVAQADHSQSLAQIGASLLAIMLAGGEVLVGLALTGLARRWSHKAKAPDGV